MADDEGEAPKKSKGDDSAAARLRKQLDTQTSNSRTFANALGPTSTVQEMLESHLSAFGGIAGADRIADAYRLLEIAGINALGEAPRSVVDSFRIGSLADMIGIQSALAAFGPSLSLMENDTITQMLEGVRARQSVFESAIGAYMDQDWAQAERITSMVEALAMPRIDPARLGISSALALGKTNAFKLAGLTPDYVEEFRSITGAVNKRISAFAELGSAVEAFALQPDLVGGIGSLLAHALARQETLLEQQRQLVEQPANAQPRRQTLISERLTIIAAIVSILYFCIFIALEIEERMIGGDPATLANTAAIEQNTQAIDQMRESFDALADQLERMRTMQEEAEEEERAADAAITEILREIANTLANQADGEEKTP
ncbi:MAG: hypothetical protein MI741_22560 [Rhodospirillales bacterium]|nr:hypothetical protein [Rhodospirillales bacterium]